MTVTEIAMITLTAFLLIINIVQNLMLQSALKREEHRARAWAEAVKGIQYALRESIEVIEKLTSKSVKEEK